MRFYETPEGERVPSVTTVLSLTLPAKDRYALDLHVARNPLAAWQRRQEGRDRGTVIDGWFKRWVRKPSTPFPFDRRSICDRLIKWWKQKPYEVLSSDLTVFGPGYAGTLDLVVALESAVYVLEVKTSGFMFHEVTKREARLQAIAYRNAANSRPQDFGHIHGIITLHVSPYGLEDSLTVQPPDCLALTRDWNQRLHKFQYSYREALG